MTDARQAIHLTVGRQEMRRLFLRGIAIIQIKQYVWKPILDKPN